MSNNFSQLKLDKTSQKILLARIKPARSIAHELSVVTGFTYQMTFPYETLCGIQVNNVTFTKVSSSPSLNQYSFDESTRLLTLTLGADISFYLSVGQIIAYYYLFYTNDRPRFISEDPEDDQTTIRYWDSRIKGSPSLTISQEDVIDGFLSISNTTLSLINEDSNFQQYLTDYDSFSNKEIKIWSALNSTENLKKFYSGRVVGVEIGKSVNLSVDNDFTLLNKTYFPNGTLEKSIFSTGNYSSMHPNFVNKPIPRIFSRLTSFESGDYQMSTRLSTGGLGSSKLFKDAPYAFNVNYNQTPGTSSNRNWACFIYSGTDGSTTQTISNVSPLGLNRYTLDVPDATKFMPGDNIVIQSTVGYVEHRSTSTQLYIHIGGVTPANGNSIFRPDISAVLIEDPSKTKNDSPILLELVYSRDYTISTDSNNVRRINLVNNFESNFGDYGVSLSPDANVFYRAWNNENLSHGTIVQHLIQNSGLAVDSSSITAANLTSAEVAFTVPFKGSDQFQSHREYLQAILKSTMGILNYNNDFEIEYLLISAPSSGEVTSDNELMKDSFQQTIDYKDIFSELVMHNKHGYIGITSTTSFTVEDTKNTQKDSSSKAQYLHGIVRIKEIEHVLRSTANVFSRIKSILENRRASYSITTKGPHFESEVGDNITIENNRIIGNAESKNIKILSIEKKHNETRVSGSDLLGL